MNLLKPTNSSVTRAIDITARAALVIADIALILFFLTIVPAGYISLLFAVITLTGVILSFYRRRWGTILLLAPIIFIGIWVVVALYNDYFRN